MRGGGGSGWGNLGWWGGEGAVQVGRFGVLERGRRGTGYTYLPLASL